HSSYDKETRANHTPENLAILFGWLNTHRHHSFPSAEEKRAICEKTGLTLTQVNDWFVNARRRYL
ncbi:homeobox KN domain-containing protein, partial [Syncephalis pseudoplumigaleata]